MNKVILVSMLLVVSACGGSSDLSTPPGATNVYPTAILTPNPVASPSAIPTIVQHPCLLQDSEFVTAEGGCKSKSTGLVLAGISDSIMNNALAPGYCQSLVESGYSDWRLATDLELEDLLYLNRLNFSTRNKADFIVMNYLSLPRPASWNGSTLLVNNTAVVASASVFCVRQSL